MKSPVSRLEVTQVFIEMVKDNELALMSFLKQD